MAAVVYIIKVPSVMVDSANRPFLIVACLANGQHTLRFRAADTNRAPTLWAVADMNPSLLRRACWLKDELVERRQLPDDTRILATHLIARHMNVGRLTAKVLRCRHSAHRTVENPATVATRHNHPSDPLAQRFEHLHRQ